MSGWPRGCPSWPRKRIYWTSDEASLGLRKMWDMRRKEGSPDANLLAAYECGAKDFPRHWHLGRRQLVGVA